MSSRKKAARRRLSKDLVEAIVDHDEARRTNARVQAVRRQKPELSVIDATPARIRQLIAEEFKEPNPLVARVIEREVRRILAEVTAATPVAAKEPPIERRIPGTGLFVQRSTNGVARFVQVHGPAKDLNRLRNKSRRATVHLESESSFRVVIETRDRLRTEHLLLSFGEAAGLLEFARDVIRFWNGNRGTT